MLPSDIQAGDDGTGINGIGFRPTAGQAAARSLKRRRQLEEWRRREEREEREKRREKRRGAGPSDDAGVRDTTAGGVGRGKDGGRMAERRVRRRESKGALRSVVAAGAAAAAGAAVHAGQGGMQDVVMEDGSGDEGGDGNERDGQRRSVRFAAQVVEVE